MGPVRRRARVRDAALEILVDHHALERQPVAQEFKAGDGGIELVGNLVLVVVRDGKDARARVVGWRDRGLPARSAS